MNAAFQPPIDSFSDDRTTTDAFAYPGVISEIGALPWGRLTQSDGIDLAWAYYFFSIQFRENLETALALFPDDEKLRELRQGECDTDNLSPWPDVAEKGERMHHDEFMRRLLALTPIPEEKRRLFQYMGARYLDRVRALPDLTRAMSLASYEDGGLEQVFNAMLKAPLSADPLSRGFRHFLSEHIRFDSDVDAGHGTLIRHLRPDDRVLPLWRDFLWLLTDFVPALREAPSATDKPPVLEELQDRAA